MPGSNEVVEYGQIAAAVPAQGNLGTSIDFQGQTQTGTLAASQTHHYFFSIQASELASTATGAVLVRATVAAAHGSLLLPAAVEIEGLTPLGNYADGTRLSSVFEIRREGMYLLRVAGADPQTAGAYQLELAIVGDVNDDGAVDGLDSQIVTGAEGTQPGDPAYLPAADLDGSGVVDQGDVLLLMWNYGFTANRAPHLQTPQPTASTHVDLSLGVSVASSAIDPDGDAIAYRVVGATHGEAVLDPSGTTVTFYPEVGYTGPASIQIIADDGFHPADVATISVTVSMAPLVRLWLEDSPLRLSLGESRSIAIRGDFADEEGILLPPGYVTFVSTNPAVATVSPQG